MRLGALFSNGAGILLSRIFGFVRDLLMASVLGASIYSDIFFVAFKIPNLFRRIFAEGAFAQSFLPAFIASRHKALFASGIFLLFMFGIILLSIVVGIFSQGITELVAPGFSALETVEASRFVAIQFWYLPMIFAVSFMASLLQYREHFATTAFSTVLLNIALIFALMWGRGSHEKEIVEILSWAVLAGGLLQITTHILALRAKRMLRLLAVGFASLGRYGYRSTMEIRRFFKNFVPAVWGNSTAQVMAFLDTWLASFLVSGSISYLYYANRVFQLPLALFAIALSVAIFPSIAKSISAGDEEGALSELSKGFVLLLFLLATATIVGMVFSREIIWLLFERGSFTREDTLVTATLLSIYLVSLLPFGMAKLFSLWLYSRHEQMRAAKIATYALLAYTLSALATFSIYGIYALAAASVVSSFANLTLLLHAFGFEKLGAIISRRRLSLFILFCILLTLLSSYIEGVLYPYIFA